MGPEVLEVLLNDPGIVRNERWEAIQICMREVFHTPFLRWGSLQSIQQIHKSESFSLKQEHLWEYLEENIRTDSRGPNAEILEYFLENSSSIENHKLIRDLFFDECLRTNDPKIFDVLDRYNFLCFNVTQEYIEECIHDIIKGHALEFLLKRYYKQNNSLFLLSENTFRCVMYYTNTKITVVVLKHKELYKAEYISALNLIDLYNEGRLDILFKYVSKDINLNTKQMMTFLNGYRNSITPQTYAFICDRSKTFRTFLFEKLNEGKLKEILRLRPQYLEDYLERIL